MNTTLRSDIRARARDYLNESTASLWSDAQLNRYINEGLNSLPSKDIYYEDILPFTLVVDQLTYTYASIGSLIFKVERLERNDGTASLPDWNETKAWDNYKDTIILRWRPSRADSMQVFVKKYFTVPTGDVVALDLPDDKCEILVWGVVVRAYKQLIGYLRGSVSWDTVTKPGDLSIPAVQGWLRDARKDYQDLVQQYATSPRPRDIDLVS